MPKNPHDFILSLFVPHSIGFHLKKKNSSKKKLDNDKQAKNKKA